MAAYTHRPKFAPADLVKYKNAGQFIVLSITRQLGFNKYNIISIENGEFHVANTHELTKINNAILGDESDGSEFEEDIQPIEKLTEKVNKSRFKSLNQEELDQLAQKRTERATDKQTTWAVKILKGKNLVRHIVNKGI